MTSPRKIIIQQEQSAEKSSNSFEGEEENPSNSFSGASPMASNSKSSDQTNGNVLLFFG